MSSTPERVHEFEAIVAGGLDYGEADRIVHLLTERGRLRAFAHGARKSKRRFAGVLEPFQTLRILLDDRSRGGMPTLKSATVERSRLGIRDELPRIALASYVVELASLVSPEDDPAPELYLLVVRVLDRLAQAPANLALRRAFELTLLDVLGYRPALDCCTECGLRSTEQQYLDLERGGLLCRQHAQGAPAIGPRTLHWMAAVLEGDSESAQFDELAGTDREWAERAAKALGGPMRAVTMAWAQKPLKSQLMLQELGL